MRILFEITELAIKKDRTLLNQANRVECAMGLGCQLFEYALELWNYSSSLTVLLAHTMTGAKK